MSQRHPFLSPFWFSLASTLVTIPELIILCRIIDIPFYIAFIPFVCMLLFTFIGVTSVRIKFFLPLINKKRDKKGILLTFDDGPTLGKTEEVLDLLKKHGIKALFFSIGKKADQNPELIKRIVQDGHSLGSHSWSHKWYTNFLLGADLDKEIKKGMEILQTLKGSPTQFFRPPMGLTNPHLAKVIYKMNLIPIGWSIRTFDTGERRHKNVYRRMMRAGKGDIILLHDGGPFLKENLPWIEKAIIDLRKKGFEFADPRSFFDLPA